MILLHYIMEWSNFHDAPKRCKRYVEKLNQMLTGKNDAFYIDAFLQPNAIQDINNFLDNTIGRNNKPLSKSSRKSYFAAVSKYLHIAQQDNKKYKIVITELANEIKLIKPQIINHSLGKQRLLDDINFVINNPGNHTIKLLACIIRFDLGKLIRITELCNTRCDFDDKLYNYIDLHSGIWTIRRKNAVANHININKTFIQCISKGKGDIWITGKNHIDNPNGISVMFKKRFGGNSFKTIDKLFNSHDHTDNDHNDNDTDNNDTDTDHNDENDTDNVDDDVVTDNIDIDNTTSTKKIKIAVRKKIHLDNGIDWGHLDNNNIRDSTALLYLNTIKKIQKKLTGKDDKFYIQFFTDINTPDKVMQCLNNHRKSNNEPYAPSTKALTLKTICKLTQKPGLSAITHNLYSKLLDDTEKCIDELNKLRTIPDFNNILKDLRYLLKNSDITNLRIILWLIIASSDPDSDQNIGVLRFSDIINTKLSPDKEFSYIDLNKNVWFINKDKTKNNTQRSFTLNQKVLYGLQKITDMNKRTWLIQNQKGNKYNKTNYLSKQFKDKIKVSYTTVRASYVTFMNKHLDDVGLCQNIANNMGHTYKTREKDYIRDILNDYDDDIDDDDD